MTKIVLLGHTINIEVMQEINIHLTYSFDPNFDNKEGIIRIT